MKSGAEALHDYCEQHSSNPGELLNEIDRQTHLQTTQPRMLSGKLQGRFLAMISKLARPKRILEIGTFTGYATLCLAEGLQEEGELHTLEVNPELEPFLEKYWSDSPLQSRIHLHLQDAVEFLGSSRGPWDLVFVDAAKKQYPRYFELLQSQTVPGSLIIADNVLWSGKVLEDEPDATTAALVEFSRIVHEHPDWENVMVPLRDGLMLARKK